MKKNKMTDWFICFVVVLGTCAFAVSEQEVKLMGNAMPDKPVVQPAKERTMLVFSLCRGFKHSSVPYWARALDIMSEKTGAFKVVHSDDMSVFTPQSLERFDVICLNNTTKLTPDEAQQKAILDFIKGGRGIVGIHAATDNFYEWPEGMQMMGGKFTGHPWTSRGTWAVKLDEPEHPLMKPFQGKNFKIKDEIYRTEAPLYSRDNQRVLMSLDMSDPVTKNAKGVRPDDMDTGITWIKPVGQGRLFYCSLGHVHAVTWNSAVLEHFLAGIQYAMGDYKVEDRPLGEPPAKLERAALNALLGELKTYDWDKSRASLVKLEDLIKEHYLNPVTLKQIELKLVQTLDTDMPAAAKDFVCRQLAVIGSEASVEALLKMLDDPKTANLGRYALEKIPSPAVDQGVLKKLNTVSDRDTKIGMITTLGVRKCDSAVDELAKATGDNPATAAAAIQALGTIGTLKAAEQLQKMDADEGVEDALLSCAESLFEQGKTGAAQRLYSQLYASGTSSGIRAAGLTGLVRSGGDSAMLLKAVNSEDTMVQKAAMMQIATIQDVSLLKTLASEMKSLSDTAKIQMMTAFATNEIKAGRAEIERVLLAEPQNRDVRFAAYQALSELGDGSTAVWLAGYAAQAPDREEKKMAQEALYRLPGEEVDEAILAKITFNCSSAVEEPVMLELIRSTAQRPIPSACPVLLKTARRADGEIASESIRALQSLATAEYIDDVVDLLIEKPGTATENVVVAAAEKIEDRNSRAKAILEKYGSTSNEAAKVSMLRVMGKLGDPDSISLLKKELTSKDAAIQEAAFRAMTDWPGSDFMAEMKALAQSDSDAKTKILAFRAYVRVLTAPAVDANQQAIVDELIAAYAMAGRADEQKIVISALGDHANMAALKFVDEKRAEDALKAEAEVSLIQICEKLSERNPAAVKPVLETLKDSQNETVKKKAQALLKTVSTTGVDRAG